MSRLIFTVAMMIAMHAGAGVFQPQAAGQGPGFGAYVGRALAAQPRAGLPLLPASAKSVYGTVAFGEAVARPPASSVTVGF